MFLSPEIAMRLWVGITVVTYLVFLLPIHTAVDAQVCNMQLSSTCGSVQETQLACIYGVLQAQSFCNYTLQGSIAPLNVAGVCMMVQDIGGSSMRWKMEQLDGGIYSSGIYNIQQVQQYSESAAVIASGTPLCGSSQKKMLATTTGVCNVQDLAGQTEVCLVAEHICLPPFCKVHNYRMSVDIE